MRDHGSIGLPLGMGSFGGFFFGFCVFLAFSFSVLVLREANKSPTHRILVGNQREKTTLGHGFLFFLLFIWWQFCIVQILSGPKTFLHISSSFFDQELSFLPFLLSPILWLGIFFLFFFLSPTLWLGISFLFFLTFSLIGNFPSLFLWLEISLLFFFASEGKDWHSHPGSRFMVSQDFGSRLVEWLDMIHVRVWFGSRIKGMPHIISMTQMQKWWFGNFMQNWSCMHLCGHSSVKFLWSCDARAQDSFPLF